MGWRGVYWTRCCGGIRGKRQFLDYWPPFAEPTVLHVAPGRIAIGWHAEMPDQIEILKQLDAVLTKHRELRSGSKYEDCSDKPEIAITTVNALMCDAIGRFAPPDSQYTQSMKSLLQKYTVARAYIVPHLAGILNALRIAYAEGYLATVAELVHADIFSDFVEMAEYLLSEGYKDPAAVIIGSVLEEHLRQLCAKNLIPVDAAGKSKKAYQLMRTWRGRRSIQSSIRNQLLAGLICEIKPPMASTVNIRKSK
jgi:hypothetical protein